MIGSTDNGADFEGFEQQEVLVDAIPSSLALSKPRQAGGGRGHVHAGATRLRVGTWI